MVRSCPSLFRARSRSKGPNCERSTSAGLPQPHATLFADPLCWVWILAVGCFCRVWMSHPEYERYAHHTIALCRARRVSDP